MIASQPARLFKCHRPKAHQTHWQVYRILCFGAAMKIRFRFLLIVFYVTVVLVYTAYLRSEKNRLFYNIRKEIVQQDQIKQKLWQKQVRLESLLSPSRLSKGLQKEFGQ